MAGPSLGAPAPQSLAPMPAVAGAPLTRIAASSRTRHVYGVFNLGVELVVVYVTRRQRDGAAVTIEVGDGAQRLAGDFSPAHARSLARALVVAAEAAELALRRPPVERRPVPAAAAGAGAGALPPSSERVLRAMDVAANDVANPTQADEQMGVRFGVQVGAQPGLKGGAQ